MGRGQVILRDENGVLCGATEKRTDGQIMSY
jgi:gamma-glutamyltranspeptidase/glutathione hydrolase